MSFSRYRGWTLLALFGTLDVDSLHAQLTENCTVSVLNRNIQVKADGTWVLPNIPANQGRIRARATCTLNGITRFGQSGLFTITQNGSVDVPPITLGTVTPIPQSLTISTPAPALSQAGANAQLTVLALYPDSTSANVTAGTSGTNYITNNPAIATISPDGLVQAITSGTALITAFNEGTSGSVSIRVGIAPTVTITSPVAGATVTEGATIPVKATTTGTVAIIKFLADSKVVFTANTAPYQFLYTVPLGVTSITLGAQADNGFGDVGTAKNVPINVARDPRTTVTGRVLDSSSAPVSSAVVTVLGQFSSITAANGTFSIPGVSTVRGNIVAVATATLNSVQLVGISGSVAPVPSGTTLLGDIVLSSTSSNGRFAYVTNLISNSVSVYGIDPTTGALALVSGSPFPTGGEPLSVAVDPTGRFAYVANGQSNNISAYSINATSGTLALVPGSPFPAGTGPFSVAVDPTGRFVYVVNSTSPGNISAYSVDTATGVLTQVPGSPFPAGGAPVSVAVDPTSRFAYVANENPANISAYSINATTGALTLVPGSPFPAGGGFAVAVDPTGRFVYVADGGIPGTVTAYNINAATGALVPVPGSPFPAGGITPRSVTVDPTGRFVYVPNLYSNDVSAYSINPASGALALVGLPSPAGSAPVSVAVDPTGRFAYLANANSGNISAYSINATTGVLTLVPGSPFPAGGEPFSITVGSAPRLPELVALPCSQESSLKSIQAMTATSILFANTTSQDRKVYWLDYNGNRVLYSTLSSGAGYVQSTFLTNPWLITDSSGQCLDIYMPVNGIGRVTIKQ